MNTSKISRSLKDYHDLDDIPFTVVNRRLTAQEEVDLRLEIKKSKEQLSPEYRAELKKRFGTQNPDGLG